MANWYCSSSLINKRLLNFSRNHGLLKNNMECCNNEMWKVMDINLSNQEIFQYNNCLKYCSIRIYFGSHLLRLMFQESFASPGLWTFFVWSATVKTSTQRKQVWDTVHCCLSLWVCSKISMKQGNQRDFHKNLHNFWTNGQNLTKFGTDILRTIANTLV